ncbi:MAG: 5'/3'-nucleotidase SurE [Pseudomonadota bacterium]|nr:5'/3'-nucleotidase SurE [Pseudomonadota bacterium]
MHILLSNDDGYQAPGLKALLESTKEHGEITVVAPDENKSGASGSLTLSKVLTVKATGERCFAVDGTPVDCVHIGLNGLLDNEPDMVISGINSGSNLGDDVLYSGTVGAALEGRRLAYPGVAVSLVGSEPKHYWTAGQVASAIVSELKVNPLPSRTILNVNVPDRPLEDLHGYKITRLGYRARSHPVIRLNASDDYRQYRIGTIGSAVDSGPGTDFSAVNEGYVSITPLRIDSTDHSQCEHLTDWALNLKLKS